jgi:hypothetical protein
VSGHHTPRPLYPAERTPAPIELEAFVYVSRYSYLSSLIPTISINYSALFSARRVKNSLHPPSPPRHQNVIACKGFWFKTKTRPLPTKIFRIWQKLCHCCRNLQSPCRRNREYVGIKWMASCSCGIHHVR